MTVQEAKNWLTVVRGTYNGSDKRVEAIGIAIKSMEKQISKKPKIIKHKYHNSHTCPFCDLELICSDETGYFSGKRHRYCPDCGQKLDWEEGETSD